MTKCRTIREAEDLGHLLHGGVQPRVSLLYLRSKLVQHPVPKTKYIEIRTVPDPCHFFAF